MLNVPLVRKNYQRVISKPPRDNTEVLIETFSFALVFSAWENCPGILLFAHTKLE